MSKMFHRGIVSLTMLLSLMFVLPLNASALSLPPDDNKQMNIMDFSIESGAEYIQIDDIFIDEERVLPGDSIEKTLVVENVSPYTANIYFHIEVPEWIQPDTVEMDLIQKISMTVLEDGKEIYKGNLSGANLENGDLTVPVNLGAVNPGKDVKLTAKIDVPVELDNSFTLDKTQTRWVFRAEGDEPENPETGDNTPIWFYVGIMTVAAAVSIGSFVAQVKYYKNEEE